MQILTNLAAVNGLVMNMLDVFNLYHQSGLTVMVRTMCVMNLNIVILWK